MLDLNYFKDMLFDVINENDNMNISDIEMDDRRNAFMVTALDGSVIKVECKMIRKNGICIERQEPYSGAWR